MNDNQEEQIEEISDEELLEHVRRGDMRSYGLLWERHAGPARSVARGFAGLDADDLVSEAFERLLVALQAGKGPQGAFRPYLITTVRNVARRQYNRDVPRAEIDFDFMVDADAPDGESAAIQGQRHRAVSEAFQSLPLRWQEALWYAEVDGLPPREMTGSLGLSANAVSALVLRAKRGFRDAWVTAQLARADSPECQQILSDIGAYSRGGLSPRATKKVDSHIATCESCTAALKEAREIAHSLALALLPAVAGAAGAVGYLSTMRPPTMPEMQLPVTTAAAAEGPVREGPRSLTTRRLGAAALVAVVLIGGGSAAATLWQPGSDANPLASEEQTQTPIASRPVPSPLPFVKETQDAPLNEDPVMPPPGATRPDTPVVTDRPQDPTDTVQPPDTRQNPGTPTPTVAPSDPETPDMAVLQDDSRMYPRVTGTDAVPGARIEISDATGTLVAVTTADSRGRWTMSLTQNGPGTFTVSASQTVLGLDSKPSAPVTYTVTDAPAAARPLAGAVVDATRFNFRLDLPPGTVIQRQILGQPSIHTLTVPASGAWNEYLAVTPGDRVLLLRYALPETRDFGPWAETEFTAR
ncbi:RNA polymerase sigma factor [Microbacterium foliorum]|uniref:RNA polymerase sigma factor n=2 Tax=Microbacterium foliorum TaxID=104336 RepID=A0A0F0KKX8_9MICO|nr:RNA polymerase sigma factor [Microbacterium foliorum]